MKNGAATKEESYRTGPAGVVHTLLCWMLKLLGQPKNEQGPERGEGGAYCSSMFVLTFVNHQQSKVWLHPRRAAARRNGAYPYVCIAPY